VSIDHGNAKLTYVAFYGSDLICVLFDVCTTKFDSIHAKKNKDIQ